RQAKQCLAILDLAGTSALQSLTEGQPLDGENIRVTGWSFVHGEICRQEDRDRLGRKSWRGILARKLTPGPRDSASFLAQLTRGGALWLLALVGAHESRGQFPSLAPQRWTRLAYERDQRGASSGITTQSDDGDGVGMFDDLVALRLAVR